MRSKYSRLSVLIKMSILLASVIFVFIKLHKQGSDFELLYAQLKLIFDKNIFQLALVMFLMPLNWSLEALKWKTLVKKVLEVNFQASLRGVMSGLGLSFLTPHGIGDYFGRIGQLSHKNRTRLIGPLMLGRVVQMLVTALFGMLGLYYLLGAVLFTASITVIGILIIAFFVVRERSDNLSKMKIYRFIEPYFSLIWQISLREIFHVFGLSVLRYLTFGLQFFIMLNLFIPEISDSMKFAGITWVFLAKSVLPSFNFLSDLGVREFSAVLFFEHYQVPIEPVLLASLMIWTINILVPTVLSLPLVLKLNVKL